MTTQMHRIVSVLMVALMVGLVLAGWFLVAQPQLAQAAASTDQLASVTSQTTQSQAALAELRAQKGKLGDLEKELTGLQASIPSTLGSSPLVSNLNDDAASAGVFIQNITVSDAVVYAPAGTASATASAPAAGGSTTPTATPSPSATPSPAAPATGFTPKTNAQITPANFVPVPMAITVEGGWDQTLAFVKALQGGTRLFTLGTTASKVKADDPSQYVTTVTGFVFAIIGPNGTPVAASTPSPTPTAPATHKPAPTASATPIPSGSSTPSGTPSR